MERDRVQSYVEVTSTRMVVCTAHAEVELLGDRLLVRRAGDPVGALYLLDLQTVNLLRTIFRGLAGQR